MVSPSNHYFRYLKTAITTPVNKTRLTILKLRKTTSVEVKPEGAIKMAHTHTPIAQLIEMSEEDRRRTILTIKGMLNKGMTIAASSPTCSMMFIGLLAKFGLFGIYKP